MVLWAGGVVVGFVVCAQGRAETRGSGDAGNHMCAKEFGDATPHEPAEGRRRARLSLAPGRPIHPRVRERSPYPRWYPGPTGGGTGPRGGWDS